MKTQISRDNFNPEKRFSGVYQQQGRMLTDADWNEAADIEKQRLVSVLRSLAGSGANGSRGFIRPAGTYEAPDGILQWGAFMVDGIPALVAPADNDITAPFDYRAQADYPLAPLPPGTTGIYGLPSTGDYYVYLDVWERPLTWIEDASLMDPALHGADTCTRTRTMAQVKLCPAAVDPENPELNPSRGNAALTLHIRKGETEPDPCDPCARETRLNEAVSDYLFRAEIHSVTRDNAGRIDTLELKWSSENGAEQYAMDNVPPGFRSSSHCYEVFSGRADRFASECHSGRHFIPSGDCPRQYGTGLHTTYPAPDPDLLIRRWDGFCIIRRTAGGSWEFVTGRDRSAGLGPAPEKSWHEHGFVHLGPGFPDAYEEAYTDGTEAGTTPRLIITLNTMVLRLELEQAPGSAAHFLKGDYWSKPVRSALAGEPLPLLSMALPSGIDHHYCRIARLTGGNLAWDTALWEESPGADATRTRRPALPRLDRLNAEDIGYAPPPVQAGADTRTIHSLLEAAGRHLTMDNREASVRRMLDMILSRLSAAHLPLDRDDPAHCIIRNENQPLFSVQDGLNDLCTKIENMRACVSYTVAPEPGWETVFDRIAPDENAHVCFRAGVYELSQTLQIQNKGHLKITGAGRATHIRIIGRECALLIDACAGVDISGLSMDSTAVAPFNQKSLRGVLTIQNTPEVRASALRLKCAAGTRLTATCMTVASDTAVDSVRISGCDFITGHYQGGLLVINGSRVMIRDNTVNTAPRPKVLTFETIVADKVRQGELGRQLADRIRADYHRSVRASDAAAGNIAVRVGDFTVRFHSSVGDTAWKAVFRDAPPEAADLESGNAAAAYVNRVISDLAAREAKPEAFASRLANFRTVVGEDRFAALTADPAVKLEVVRNLFAAGQAVPEADAGLGREVGFRLGDFRIGFDSVAGQGTWQSIMAADLPKAADRKSTGAAKKYLKRLANRLLTDKTFRDRFTEVAAWYDYMKQHNPAAGAQGIVCAGKKAGEIQILNNSISGTAEGIRVALSDGGYHKKTGSGIQADSLIIAGNRLSLAKPATQPRAARAVMVGNCKHLIVENNRMTAAGKPATEQLFYEGLRIYGSMGRTVLARQNSFANCLTGIRFVPLGVSAADWDGNLWIISDNIAPGAETAVVPVRIRGYTSNLT
ncbi:MAG: hypothetical protein HUN04_16525 [Desulfobacter sp.]|nr:MAG: hypothetical protein HUN04_16525 [Desulfobacter sp.]